MSKVTIVEHPVSKDLITPARHKPNTHSTIRLESTTFEAKGFGAYKKRVAFMTMRKEDTLRFVAEHKLVNGSVVPGIKIVVQESTTPSTDSAKPKQRLDAERNPVGIMTFQGQPIYRNTIATTDALALDIFLSADNQTVVLADSEALSLAGEGVQQNG